MNKAKWILSIAVILAVAAPVLADDVFPPEWRGQHRTTFQEWTFPSDGTELLPCDYEQWCPGDLEPPLATVGDGMVWSASFEGKTGVIIAESAGTIVFDVPNCPDEEPIKYMQIQMTYWPPTPEAGCPVTDVEAWKNQDEIPSEDIVLTDTLVFDSETDGWKLGLVSHEIYPNPDWERITLSLPQGYALDQIVIDTWSVPEPATMAMLMLGGVGLIARRRRTR